MKPSRSGVTRRRSTGSKSSSKSNSSSSSRKSSSSSSSKNSLHEALRASLSDNKTTPAPPLKKKTFTTAYPKSSATQQSSPRRPEVPAVKPKELDVPSQRLPLKKHGAPPPKQPPPSTPKLEDASKAPANFQPSSFVASETPPPSTRYSLPVCYQYYPSFDSDTVQYQHYAIPFSHNQYYDSCIHDYPPPPCTVYEQECYQEPPPVLLTEYRYGAAHPGLKVRIIERKQCLGGLFRWNEAHTGYIVGHEWIRPVRPYRPPPPPIYERYVTWHPLLLYYQSYE